MSLSSEFLKLTKDNRESLLKGIPTLIPFSKLPRLSEYVPGVERSSQIILSGNTGCGKSRCARALFIQEPLKFAKANKMKLKIFLNSLEESKSKVVSTLISSYLYDKYKIQTDYYSLSNFKAKSPLKEKHMALVEEAAGWVDENYGQSLEIVSEANGKSFYKIVQKYLASVGKFYFIDPVKKTKRLVTDLGKPYNHYEYNEPTIVITITDTIDKMQGYGNLSQYQAIKKFSGHYTRNLLGNVCQCINVLISQQTSENEKIEASVWKGSQSALQKSKPSLDSIKTCRAINFVVLYKHRELTGKSKCSTNKNKKSSWLEVAELINY